MFGKSEKYNYDGIKSNFTIMTHHFSEPTNFKLIGRSDKTLTVSWLDPEHKINNRGNDKYYYSITIQSENATFKNKLRVESEENKKVIEGLEPSKKYNIRIATKSTIKIDNLCPTNYIKVIYNDLMATITATTRPLTPEMPNFTDVTETSAVISWKSHNSMIKNDSSAIFYFSDPVSLVVSRWKRFK